MATLYGPIKLADNTPYVGELIFRPLHTPLADAPDLIVTQDIIVTTDVSGQFTVNLRVGAYKVWVGRDRALLVDVPDDELSYPLLSRIQSRLAYQVTEPPFSDKRLLEMAAAEAYEMTALTYDSGGVLSSASVLWNDGASGILTVTHKDTSTGQVNGYTLTHTTAQRKITQGAVTRNANGDITTKPALTITAL